MSQTEFKPHKITVRNREPGKIATGANTQVLLDGHEMKGLTFIKVQVKSRNVAKVTFEMLGELDIDLDGVEIIEE